MKSYQPTCSLEAIKARAEMYNKIRQFFAERNVLEVETPVLSQAGSQMCIWRQYKYSVIFMEN
jgi:lysyl-tRNA synthetase class 2